MLYSNIKMWELFFQEQKPRKRQALQERQSNVLVSKISDSKIYSSKSTLQRRTV